MDQMAPRRWIDDATGTRPLRRILITVGLVLAGLILVVVAIYAGAFIILAPMMMQ
ncbi:MAG TPA: hypothetical protein VKA77_18325 [Mycobacterium sp.]|jgi:hypothetical protein|nr:hypothetical protein [Mycobacterium sp.]